MIEKFVGTQNIFWEQDYLLGDIFEGIRTLSFKNFVGVGFHILWEQNIF